MGQRRSRFANVKAAVAHCAVFAGMLPGHSVHAQCERLRVEGGGGGAARDVQPHFFLTLHAFRVVKNIYCMSKLKSSLRFHHYCTHHNVNIIFFLIAIYSLLIMDILSLDPVTSASNLTSFYPFVARVKAN